MLTATNGTQCWQHNNHMYIQNLTAAFPVCLAATDDLHYTVHAQHRVHSSYRRMWTWGGGGIGTFSSFCSVGSGGWHIPGWFHCHHEDRGQSRHTPQSRKYPEPGAPAIVRENKDFRLSCNLKSVCCWHKSTEKYMNNSIFPFFCESRLWRFYKRKCVKYHCKVKQWNPNLLDGSNVALLDKYLPSKISIKSHF